MTMPGAGGASGTARSGADRPEFRALRSVVSLCETVRPQCDLRIPAARVLATLNSVDGIN
jgi:hypothetical protein